MLQGYWAHRETRTTEANGDTAEDNGTSGTTQKEDGYTALGRVLNGYQLTCGMRDSDDHMKNTQQSQGDGLQW